jgi:hypothetical protein
MHDEVTAEDSCFGAFAWFFVKPQTDDSVSKPMGEEEFVSREATRYNGFGGG